MEVGPRTTFWRRTLASRRWVTCQHALEILPTIENADNRYRALANRIGDDHPSKRQGSQPRSKVAARCSAFREPAQLLALIQDRPYEPLSGARRGLSGNITVERDELSISLR